MAAPPPLNRVYGAKVGWKLFALVLCSFNLVFYSGALYRRLHGVPSASTLAVGGLLLAAGILVTVYAFRASVRFTATAVEHRTLFKTTRLPLAAIRGRKEFVVSGEEGSTRYLRLVPDDDRLPVMDFAKIYSFDDSFFQWFDGLRDLDTEEKQHKNSNFGLV